MLAAWSTLPGRQRGRAPSHLGVAPLAVWVLEPKGLPSFIEREPRLLSDSDVALAASTKPPRAAPMRA
jgi:hypothetical protein